MRTKIMGDSFKTTKSFANSMGLVIANRFAKGSQDFKSVLTGMYLKKLGIAF